MGEKERGTVGKNKERKERKEKNGRKFKFLGNHRAVSEKQLNLLHPPLDQAQILTEHLGHIVF